MDNNSNRDWRQKFALKKHSKRLKKHALRIESATIKHAHRFLVGRLDKIRDVRRHIIIWFGGVGLLIAFVGLQVLWFQQSYINEAPVSGGTFAEGLKGPIDTLNPLFAASPAELSSSHLLFSSLYANDTTGKLRGDLATSMKNDSDKVYTVTIRKDARWHDGEDLKSDDIIYTIDLMKNPAVRSVMGSSWQGIEAKKIDDYTLQLSLPAAYAAFPQALTFAVLPKHNLEKVTPSRIRESTFSSEPVGSGPFRMRLLQTLSQTTGRKIVHMEANRDYYLGAPRLERLQLHAFVDDDSMARALRTGEVSAISDVSGVIAKGFKGSQFDTMNIPVNSGVYALFNLTTPVLKDVNVRKSLLQGTSTADIRKALFGSPRSLHLPFVTGQVSGTDDIPTPVFNRKQAIQTLESNGWVLKDGVRTKGSERLHLRVVTRRNPDYEIALQQLAGQWRQMGVEVDTQVVGASDFTQDVLRLRNYDVLLDKLVIGGDPDVFAYWHSRGILNFTGYGSQISDDTLTSARTKSDPTLRDIKYEAFSRQWLADVPAIGLYQPNLIYIHTKKTHAISSEEVIVTPDDHYAGVRFWTAENARVYKTP